MSDIYQPPKGATSNPHKNNPLGSPSARIPSGPLGSPESLPDRYHTSRWQECDKGHRFRQTMNPCKDNRYEPLTCPSCDFEARKADLARVLAKNSDLKGKDNGN